MEVAASPARVARSPIRSGDAPPVPSSFRARGYRRPSRGAAKPVMPPTPGGVQQLGPPVQSTPSPNMQPQSRRKRGREGKALASTSFKPCNCKKSKCLKLYCECYAAGVFCRDCNCLDCLTTKLLAYQGDKAKEGGLSAIVPGPSASSMFYIEDKFYVDGPVDLSEQPRVRRRAQ